MTIDRLKKAAAKAHDGFQRAEARAEELQRKAQTAKARAEQARQKRKQARRSAKQARRLALAAEERVCKRLRIWEKAQKRLAKAMKKATKTVGAKRLQQVRHKGGSPARRTALVPMPRKSVPGRPARAAATANAASDPSTPAA